MLGSYETRKVANYNVDDIFVDTCSVTDSEQPFETAVQHPGYNGGEMIIVEMYETREAAKVGHARWVKTMTGKKLPAYLRDVSTAGIKRLAEALGALPKWDKRERAEPKRKKTKKKGGE